MLKLIVSTVAGLAIAALAGGGWYYFQAETNCKTVAGPSLPIPGEVTQAQKLNLDALKRLENAREHEDTARKSGDSAKIAEAAEAVKRAAEVERAAADVVRKHQAASDAALRNAANSIKTAKVGAGAVTAKPTLSCKNAA